MNKKIIFPCYITACVFFYCFEMFWFYIQILKDILSGKKCPFCLNHVLLQFVSFYITVFISIQRFKKGFKSWERKITQILHISGWNSKKFFVWNKNTLFIYASSAYHWLVVSKHIFQDNYCDSESINMTQTSRIRSDLWSKKNQSAGCKMNTTNDLCVLLLIFHIEHEEVVKQLLKYIA